MAEIAKEDNFQGELTPRLIANEYHNCNFSFKEPLDKDGKKVGHLLDVKAKFVECNLVNREPHPDAVIIRCNLTIVDTEIAERVKVDHTEEIESSNLSEEYKAELLKTAKIEIVRNVIRTHKVYGYFDTIKKEYVYKIEVAP